MDPVDYLTDRIAARLAASLAASAPEHGHAGCGGGGACHGGAATSQAERGTHATASAPPQHAAPPVRGLATLAPHDRCGTCTVPGRCITVCPDITEGALSAGADRISTIPGVTEFRRDLASLIDHTLLKPEASRAQVEHLCAEAARYGFASVCINPCWVSLCSRLLEGYTARVCTVIGFPLGASTSQVKAAEAALAVEQGAHEVDMVLNVGALKSAQYAYVQEDVRAVVEAVGRRAVVKVILETCLLSDEEKVLACELARRAGAHFVKTSTGFASGGATLGDVALMRRVVGEGIGVKASGGVRDQRTADLMVMAGATRIGASASVRIVANGKQPA